MTSAANMDRRFRSNAARDACRTVHAAPYAASMSTGVPPRSIAALPPSSLFTAHAVKAASVPDRTSPCHHAINNGRIANCMPAKGAEEEATRAQLITTQHDPIPLRILDSEYAPAFAVCCWLTSRAAGSGLASDRESRCQGYEQVKATQPAALKPWMSLDS